MTETTLLINKKSKKVKLAKNKSSKLSIQALIHDNPYGSGSEKKTNKLLALCRGLWLKHKVNVGENSVSIIDNRPYYRLIFQNMDIIFSGYGAGILVVLFGGLTHVIGSILAAPFLIAGLRRKKKLIQSDSKARLYYDIIQQSLKKCDKENCYQLHEIESYQKLLTRYEEKLDNYKQKLKMCQVDNYPNDYVKQLSSGQATIIQNKIENYQNKIKNLEKKLINVPLRDNEITDMLEKFHVYDFSSIDMLEKI